MAFANILGNDRLMQNLSASIRKNRFSHFYLISGPAGSGKHTLADFLAGALLCTGQAKPCGVCSACRKVLSKAHPDYITIDDPDHKTVPVKLIREARESIFIRPNESERKVYLFPQEMGVEGQNALLKILEEPPVYGVFILLTDNPEKLLPTVRSRCTELKLLPLPEAVLHRQLRQDFPTAQEEEISGAILRSGGFLGQARQLLSGNDTLPPQTESFVRALASRDALTLVQTLAPMEKWKRDALLPILQSWLELAESALACRSGIHALSPLARQLAQMRTAEDLYEITGLLKKALEYTMSNVSPAAVCGWLSWALR